MTPSQGITRARATQHMARLTQHSKGRTNVQAALSYALPTLAFVAVWYLVVMAALR